MAAASDAEKENTTAFVVDFGETEADAGGSLQGAFAKFRRDKAKALELRAGPAKVTRTPEQKEELRHKFLEQCRSYMGVPYKKKFFEEGTPEFDSPIFLDCCGLVRRAMWDLQEDFGFRLGNWNQAYQWDTLASAEVEEPSQLKPGDLVFYAADYTNTKAKAQKFRMVHVEVWLGGDTGEATLGARWKRGKVSEFGSYKFASSSWSGVEYHFCSIDPWLSGECVPKNSHMWRMRSLDWMRNDKSVFSAAEDQGEEEPAEDADADDEDGDEGAAASDAAAGDA